MAPARMSWEARAAFGCARRHLCACGPSCQRLGGLSEQTKRWIADDPVQARNFAQRRKRLFEQIGPMGIVEQDVPTALFTTAGKSSAIARSAPVCFEQRLCRGLGKCFEAGLAAGTDIKSALDLNHDAEDLARRYFQDSGAKAEVSSLLRQSGLNETSIEAEAFRLCAADLEAINRIIQFKQDRSDNDLGLLAAIRQGGLACLQAEGDATNEDEVPRLIDVKRSRLIMASARQIAANRANARKSSGPRSAAGKTRSSQNACRHGLSRRMSGAKFARAVEALAHDIAGDTTDQVTLGLTVRQQRGCSNLIARAALRLR